MAKNSGGFAVNDRIQHEDYGPGTITEIGVRHTTIEFDQAGKRKFMSSMVRLERSEVAAPPRSSGGGSKGKAGGKKRERKPAAPKKSPAA